MAKVMIHACNDRLWYVNEYIVPSMTAQGVARDDITVWLDKESKGNLKSFLESCRALADTPGGTWHLQDDVLIAHDFSEKINEHDNGIVCAFCHDLYETEGCTHLGPVVPFLAWQSCFQCIRIPNETLGHFYKWFNEVAIHDEELVKRYISKNRSDDTLFRIFMCNERSWDRAYNLAPHLVEHVDFLIGGSQINKWRGYWARGAYFYDDYLVDNLIQDLAKRRTR